MALQPKCFCVLRTETSPSGAFTTSRSATLRRFRGSHLLEKPFTRSFQDYPRMVTSSVYTPSVALSLGRQPIHRPSAAYSSDPSSKPSISNSNTPAANSLIFESGIAVRLHRKKVAVGEDAFFMSSDGTALGVADGVGGWILRGVDPGVYARTLMAKASEEANANANNRDPTDILQKAYDKVMALDIKGSTTACIVTLVGSTLYSANLGDSGYMVIRKGAVLYKSGAQQHGFNYPFQLGTGDDIPSDAFEHKIELREGDMVILGSDGLFDNLFPEKIVEEVQSNPNASVQQTADRLATLAFQNSVSEEKVTPWGSSGGKEDDITVVVARVKAYVPSFFQ